MKKYLLAAFAVFAFSPAFAQSAGFRLGKWTEIQNAIIKELNRSYVDSLPIDRIQRAGVDAMLESLDPYTMYVPEEDNEDFEFMIGKTYGGIGAIIYKPDTESNVIINEPYADSPAANAGLRCGDEIVSIDGKTVKGLKADEATSRMKGNPGTTVVFGVKKAFGGDGWKQGDTVEVRIVRQRIHLPDVEYAGMLNDTTGYILQTGFTERVSEDVRNAYLKLKAQGMKKLVLDLRGNGGGLLQEAVNIVSLFVPKGSVVVSSRGNENHPEEVFRTMREPVDTEIPIVVLVDSGTASSSEIVSGAFQDLDRATILGSRTYGKGLVQSVRPLPYNGQLKVTTAKYYTPSGRCIQKPFTKGDALSYAMDLDNRYKHGEFTSADSIHFADSLKYYTLRKHRTVYGGGGIMPDFFVPLDTTVFTPFHRQLSAKSFIINANLRFIDHNRKRLKKQYPDFKTFQAKFEVPQSYIDDILDEAKKQNITPKDDDELQRTLRHLRPQLKALVARDLWDMSEYFHIWNEESDVIKCALKQLGTE